MIPGPESNLVSAYEVRDLRHHKDLQIRQGWAPWSAQAVNGNGPWLAKRRRNSMSRAEWERLHNRDQHWLGLLGPIVGKELGYL